MHITNISTEELIKEINKRKSREIPVLINQINENLEKIKVLVGSINHETEPFKLDKLGFDDYGNVIYINSEN